MNRWSCTRIEFNWVRELLYKINITYVGEKWAASNENCEARFFKNSWKTRTMFHGQNGHTHESWTIQKGYGDKYIIIYTNDWTVQGQAHLLSTSKVGYLLKRRFKEHFLPVVCYIWSKKTITKSNLCLSVCLVCAVLRSPISPIWGIFGKYGYKSYIGK